MSSSSSSSSSSFSSFFTCYSLSVISCNLDCRVFLFLCIIYSSQVHELIDLLANSASPGVFLCLNVLAFVRVYL